MNRFKCPHCLQEVQIEDNMAGQAMTCPHCSKQFAIPTANGVPMASVNGMSAPPPSPKSLGMATASMILGIISFIGVPFCGLAALITGIISTSKISNSHGLFVGKGQAITGIIFGCWSILRIPIMLGILLPVWSAAREKARVFSCTSNLKQINLAAVMYASDNDDYLPVSMKSIQQYLGDDTVLKCPNDGNIESENYFFLPLETKKLNEITTPSETPIVICTHHIKVIIVAFADGHVETWPKWKTPKP